MSASSGRIDDLPMFPLGSVLLPGEPLPLHVFEPRYRAMVDRCMTSPHGPKFGVVLIERGHEVGGGDSRENVATIAEITRCVPLEDGRYVVQCHGTDRIRVTEWLEDDPYPRARVEPWPDEAHMEVPEVTVLIDKVRSLLTVLGEIAAERGLDEPSLPALDLLASTTLTPGGSSDAVYAVASVLPLGPSDKLRVLAAPSVYERVAVLSAAVDDVIAVAEFSRLPPT